MEITIEISSIQLQGVLDMIVKKVKGNNQKMQIKQFYLGMLGIFVLILNCTSKTQSQYQFWNDYFLIQNAIRSKYSDMEIMGILNGNMTEKQEKSVQQNSEGHFFLTIFSSKKTPFNLQDRSDLNSQKDDFFFLSSRFIPAKFKNLETYKNLRIVEYNLFPIYTYVDFFKWVRSVQQLDSITLTKDPTYAFLCEYFLCQVRVEKENFWIDFSLTKKLETLDSAVYSRLKTILDRAIIQIDVSIPEKEKIFSLSNDKNKFQIYLNQKDKIPNSLDKLIFKISLDANFYGLKIQINNLLYQMNFTNSKNVYTIVGKFVNIPEYKVSGRLGYIVPTSILNLFIPGNIDEYFQDFFDLRLNGNDGKGSFWKLISTVDKNKMNVKSISESEIPRKPFRFLSSDKKSKDTHVFQIELEKKILESMK